MRRRGKTFLSLFLSAVIVTGQPVLAADFSAGEETFISETTEQEGDVSEASAIFEDTVDSDSEMRYEKYEATVSSEILDLGQTGVNGGGWESVFGGFAPGTAPEQLYRVLLSGPHHLNQKGNRLRPL